MNHLSISTGVCCLVLEKGHNQFFVYLRTVASVILAGEGRDATSADLTGNAPTKEPMLANSPTNASALPRTMTPKSCAASAH